VYADARRRKWAGKSSPEDDQRSQAAASVNNWSHSLMASKRRSGLSRAIPREKGRIPIEVRVPRDEQEEATSIKISNRSDTRTAAAAFSAFGNAFDLLSKTLRSISLKL
jgi:hypothetical protein